jgi:uncharacterized protein YyaL (SSP411 family)
MTNRLADESSPYLLQHKNNPVDWYPWNEEALSRAKDEDRPIFLSIGYSACHWCHVMEHESFEDEGIARILNDNFVCIKVDREERPDLDQIYMNAVMALRNGQGGWPLSAFLTPERDVFFGGTYWPPKSRMGMPGFDQVLLSVLDAFQNKRAAVSEQSKKISEWLNRSESESAPVEASLIVNGVRMLENQFDFQHGGFGTAPKFPHAMDLALLSFVSKQWPENGSPSRQTVESMVDLNLSKMSLGGIYDHLGGGFARYSVDERWLVPHFEKMLYDNALLTFALLERFQILHDPADSDEYQLPAGVHYPDVIHETFEYQLREMTGPEGGFFSTEDADSEGVEGKFYVWSKEEVLKIGASAGHDWELLCEFFDVSEGGNFEGQNILNIPVPLKEFAKRKQISSEGFQQEVNSAKSVLLEVRSHRVRPGLDDKILTSWNALMIRSMARGGVVFASPQGPKYLNAAISAAEFLLGNLRRDDGRWLHTSRNGVSSLDAYLDDYSYLLVAFVELYRSTFDEKWLVEANSIAEQMIEHFHDESGGGFYFTADDHEQLIARTKPFQDSSVPSGNSMAAYGLLKLGRLIGNQRYVEIAAETIEAGGALMARSPMASGQMLVALAEYLLPHHELVLVVPESDREAGDKICKSLQAMWIGNSSLICMFEEAGLSEDSLLSSLLKGRDSKDSQTTLYVCQDGACQLPVVGKEAIETAVAEVLSQQPMWNA